MKIVDKRDDYSLSFEDLAIGDVFCTSLNDDKYLKINCSFGGYVVELYGNALNLNSSYIEAICDAAPVMKPISELVIKGME